MYKEKIKYKYSQPKHNFMCVQTDYMFVLINIIVVLICRSLCSLIMAVYCRNM
jgi:hypothetical protein